MLEPGQWTARADQILARYARRLYKGVKRQGWDLGGQGGPGGLQWGLPGALLYAITVITTIGMHGMC